MPIEDSTVIDIVLAAKDGWLEFVITDAGAVEDPNKRLELLHRKLLAYSKYLLSEQFGADHPGADPNKVRIRVISQSALTSAMQSINEVTARGNGISIHVPVSFEVFS